MQSVKIALIITYHGKNYDGWQDNFNNISIEGSLKKAFFQLLGKSVLLDAASRTDKGVHAYNQVVIAELSDLKIPFDKLLKALNAHLPDDIRIKQIINVPDEFHPSLSAKEKTYLYKINLKKVSLPFEHDFFWHIPMPLDIELMKAASTFMIGTKDFSCFSNMTKKESLNPICSITSINFIDLSHQTIGIEITGNRFLYKMCRIVVGTLVAVGKGNLKPDNINQIFIQKKRMNACVTAPAHGLFLKALYYPEFASIDCK